MGRGELLDILNAKQNDIARHGYANQRVPTRPALGPRGRCGAGWLERGGLVGGRSCSQLLAPAASGDGPGRGPEAEDFVGLTGLAAPALLGWSLRVTVGAWSVSVWVRPR